MGAKHFVRGAALGALFASVTALLLAPKAGKKTRSDVAGFAKKFSQKLNEELVQTSSLTKQQYEDILSKTGTELAKGKSIAKNFVHDMTAVLKEYFAEVKKELSTIQDDLSAKAPDQKKAPSKTPAKKSKAKKA